MQVYAENRGDSLYLSLKGEMDEHSAVRARSYADRLAEASVGGVRRAVFDLGDVSFMDSTGIGFLIGRYKKFSSLGIPVYVTNLSSATDKILKMSGVYTIIPKI
ncbi:MAG: STAS domain-containing protein [Clostridiales bacterium]|nr:STAS domain-containing protein [Clostridiales bacterium]MBQ2769108.1 anti-sigma factor antagonist [Clostridia bacterium]